MSTPHFPVSSNKCPYKRFSINKVTHRCFKTPSSTLRSQCEHHKCQQHVPSQVFHSQTSVTQVLQVTSSTPSVKCQVSASFKYSVIYPSSLSFTQVPLCLPYPLLLLLLSALSSASDLVLCLLQWFYRLVPGTN